MGCSRIALAKGEWNEGCGQAARKEAKVLPTGACAGARRKLLVVGALSPAGDTNFAPTQRVLVITLHNMKKYDVSGRPTGV